MRRNLVLMYISAAGAVFFLVCTIGCLISGTLYLVPKLLMAMGVCGYFTARFRRAYVGQDGTKS